MWIDVNDKLPEHGQIVFVKVSKEYGVAEYDKNFGFSPDYSAYDIYCHDDTGLSVSFDRKVTHWMSIPKE